MKPKKWEIILVTLLAMGLCIWAFWPKSPGNTVSVTVNGSESGVYPLEDALSLPMEGYGGFSLTLVIENGSARVENSSCPDLICQHHTAISRAGEQIVCLPARIVITITGEEAQVDAVTQ